MTSWVRLEPSIPMETPRGRGRAILMCDYGEDHHLFWVVALDASGQIWMLANPEVRVQGNPTLGTKAEKPVQV